ncbi:MAG: DUF6462 family protein [Lachnospiraceae bacterium]
MVKPKRNENAKYITIPMAQGRYNLSYAVVRRLAKESGSLICFGNISRIDTEKLDKYLSDQFGK